MHLYSYLRGRETEKDTHTLEGEGRKREKVFLFPSHYNNQGWVRLKRGARDSIQISLVDGNNSITYTTTCCLPGCTLAGSWASHAGTVVCDVDIPGSVPPSFPSACPQVDLDWPQLLGELSELDLLLVPLLGPFPNSRSQW